MAGVQTCLPDGSGFGSCEGEVVPGPEACDQPGDENCDGDEPMCTAAHLWSRGFGSSGPDRGQSVATDAAGNVFLGGYIAGATDFGGGSLDVTSGLDAVVVKYDAAGNHLWSKRFGETGEQYFGAIGVDSAGDVLLVGETSGIVDLGGGPLAASGGTDIFIAKLDAAGNHVWSKKFGDADGQFPYALAIDAADNVLIAGAFGGSVDFGGGALTSAGGNDVFVAKLDAGGNHLWSKRFGDGASQTAEGMTTDGAGNVLVTGQMNGSADFGGGQLTSAGGADVFIAGFDSTGNHLFSKRFGDALQQISFGVACDENGSVVITGMFEGGVDFGGGPLTSAGNFDVFVAKLDATGNHVFSERFGDAEMQIGRSIETDADANVVLFGHFSGSADFGAGALTSVGTDVFLLKLDPAGNHLLSRSYGGFNTQHASDMDLDVLDNVLLTGEFTVAADFGGAPLSGAGSGDGFLVKLAP